MQPTASLWRNRAVLGWALYDWANSAFALIVITAFVPVMLGGLWNDGAPSTVTTFRLGLANGLASAFVVLLAPLLGAITDQSGRRKPWVAGLTLLGVVATALLAAVGGGGWFTGLGLFVVASVAFFAGNALYDAMLIDVASPALWDRGSAFGYGLGYLGGAVLFLACVAMVAQPAFFGVADASAAIRVAFLLVAVWWAVFTVPLMAWVRERGAGAGPYPHPAGPAAGIPAGFRQLRSTWSRLRTRRDILVFLAAYWLYIDGVYTIIKMAVDYGLSRGLTAQDVTAAILLTNFIGFPAALGFGWLGERIGPRPAILLALGVYIVATGAAVFLTTAAQFYALAATIGLVQGGVQSLSRSLYARLIPMAERGEYFGFYNMLGKFSSIVGPVLAGTAAVVTGSQRFGILSILVLFIAGMWLLTRVRLPGAAGGGPS